MWSLPISLNPVDLSCTQTNIYFFPLHLSALPASPSQPLGPLDRRWSVLYFRMSREELSANCLPLLLWLRTGFLTTTGLDCPREQQASLWRSFGCHSSQDWGQCWEFFFQMCLWDSWHFWWCDVQGRLGVGLSVKVKNTPSPAPGKWFPTEPVSLDCG